MCAWTHACSTRAHSGARARARAQQISIHRPARISALGHCTACTGNSSATQLSRKQKHNRTVVRLADPVSQIQQPAHLVALAPPIRPCSVRLASWAVRRTLLQPRAPGVARKYPMEYHKHASSASRTAPRPLSPALTGRRRTGVDIRDHPSRSQTRGHRIGEYG